MLHFLHVEGLWQSCIESIATIFPKAFAPFMSLCHILVILAIFQTFHYYSTWVFCFCFLGPPYKHMEVPRLVVESELQLRPTSQPLQYGIQAASVTYTTAHGNARSLTHWAEAKDRTRILMDTSQICFCCSTTGTLYFSICYGDMWPVVFDVTIVIVLGASQTTPT